MKKFIKAVIVASVLVSASSALATLPAKYGREKAASNGTAGTECPHAKRAVGRFDITASQQAADSALLKGSSKGGLTVQ
jgi:hypothetical protein